MTRRRMIGTAAAVLAAPAVLTGPPARAASREVTIGHVGPATGPLAAFGETDAFVLAEVRKAVAGGITAGDGSYAVKIISRDSQSSPSRAAEVAAELITRDKVDLLVAAGGPDTTNPVADQAEANEIPCITTACPWQAYFFGRNGDPARGFAWTYHFCFGLEDVIAAFIGLWNKGATNRVVGGLFANDSDGNAWGDSKIGFPAALPAAGYKLVDTGRYQPFSNDFTAQISAFKAAGAEIVTGTMVPPDFVTFWTQAAQQNFHPKIVTVGKALLIPSGVAAVGPRAAGLTSEVAWSGAFPFKSGLTGQTCPELLQSYQQQTGKPPLQLIGLQHSLFEVAIDVLRRAKSARDPEAIVAAIRGTDYHSINGPVNWSGGPVKNVCKTPLIAGQWQRAGNGLVLRIAENDGWPGIPVEAGLQMLA